jgi:serine/threonine protein kinase
VSTTSEKDRAASGHVGTTADMTPVMEDADLERARTLSLQHLRPPLQVPGYEQAQLLGRGAFGEVWKAVDSNSGRSVAIKYYSQRGGLDWSHMAREVEKLQYLFSDRYVVQLFDVGWEADPPYYVMEYMEHGSLEDRLREGPLPVAEAVRIIREVAVGLVHAHDRGILHCDLKPGNVMLDQEGKPRLADFGQSRLRHEQAPALGTLFYMAPEQADLTAAPDARWDVYALGAMLYRMITGELPYLNEESSASVSSQGAIRERLQRYTEVLRSAPRPAEHRRHPDVDAALADIIDRCLATDPDRRYRNVQSVLHALAQREARRAQRPLMILGLLGPALVVLVLALVGGFLFVKTLETAERHLLERTRESNLFAAKSVAARFSLEVDKRWRILEQEAANEPVRRWLSDENADQANGSLAEVERWLNDRHKFWNEQFTANTTSSYLFIVDRQGHLRASSPPADDLVGRYFGYREYFHGQGRQLSKEAAVPSPIRTPHRSNVFRSQPTNRPAVAFSVPIWSTDDRHGEPLGVLVMEAELGHFAEFQGARNQVAVLVDLREDEAGRRGLIVEHPHLDEQLEKQIPLGEYYVDAGTLERLDRIRQQQLDIISRPADQAAADPVAPPLTDAVTFESYTDPAEETSSGPWQASVEPVFVARGAGVADCGWAVLVQERRTETLQPLQRVRAMVLTGGLAALGVVVLIVGGLWWLAVLLRRAPGRLRGWRFWIGRGPTTTYGTGSLGSASQSQSSHDSSQVRGR